MAQLGYPDGRSTLKTIKRQSTAQPVHPDGRRLPPASLMLKIMDWKIFLTIFVSVFIAELGDKTQLATMLFAADKEVSKYTVFVAASAALIVASAIGVLAGSLLSEYVNEKYLHYVAGIGFIAIGAFTLYKA